MKQVGIHSEVRSICMTHKGLVVGRANQLFLYPPPDHNEINQRVSCLFCETAHIHEILCDGDLLLVHGIHRVCLFDIDTLSIVKEKVFKESRIVKCVIDQLQRYIVCFGDGKVAELSKSDLEIHRFIVEDIHRSLVISANYEEPYVIYGNSCGQIELINVHNTLKSSQLYPCHKGVVYKVRIALSKSQTDYMMVCSCSDDRTAMCWSKTRTSNFDFCASTPIHDGRVFDVDIIENEANFWLLATCSESGKISIFSINSSSNSIIILHKMDLPAKARVCHLSQKYLLTGAADGNVQIFNNFIGKLTHHSAHTPTLTHTIKPDDWVRSLYWRDSSEEFRILTNNGELINVKIDDDNDDDDSQTLQTHNCNLDYPSPITDGALVCIVEKNNFLAIGTLHGWLSVYHCTSLIHRSHIFHNVRVNYLSLEDSCSNFLVLLSCTHDGMFDIKSIDITQTMKVTTLATGNLALPGRIVKTHNVVPSPSENILFSLVLGTELGNVCLIYKSKTDSNVSIIEHRNKWKSRVCDIHSTDIYSRTILVFFDLGIVQTFNLTPSATNENPLSLSLVHWTSISSPIKRPFKYFNGTKCDNSRMLNGYLCGFSRTDFILFDISKSAVLAKLNIRGSRRPIDLVLRHNNSVLTLIYADKRKVCLNNFQLTQNTQHSVSEALLYQGPAASLRNHFPSTEIWCAGFLNEKIFVTGSEDGILTAISRVEASVNQFHLISRMRIHKGSIRCMHILRGRHGSSSLVIAGGSRSTLVILEEKREGHLVHRKDLNCGLDGRTTLVRERDNEGNDEIRVLNCLGVRTPNNFLIVFATDSRGYISKFIPPDLQQTYSHTYPIYAIASVGDKIVCGDTKGVVSVFSYDLELEDVLSAGHHKGAIKAFDVFSSYVASGGDDGSLALMEVSRVTESEKTTLRLCERKEGAHTSSITALKIIASSELIISVSWDMSILVSHLFSLEFKARYRHPIYAVNSLDILNTSEGSCLVLTGSGFVLYLYN